MQPVLSIFALSTRTRDWLEIAIYKEKMRIYSIQITNSYYPLSYCASVIAAFGVATDIFFLNIRKLVSPLTLPSQQQPALTQPSQQQ